MFTLIQVLCQKKTDIAKLLIFIGLMIQPW